MLGQVPVQGQPQEVSWRQLAALLLVRALGQVPEQARQLESAVLPPQASGSVRGSA